MTKSGVVTAGPTKTSDRMKSAPTDETHVVSCCGCCRDNLDNCCGDNVRATGECCCCLAGSSVEVWKGCRKLEYGKFFRNTFTLNNLKRKLPIIRWLPQYRLKHLQGDVIAGLTVGLTVLPQSIAYAKIAGLRPEYGLYTSFVCFFVYMFLGTAKDVNIGPAAVMSLLTERFGHSPVHGDPTYAIILSLMCGLVQLLMGLLHLGFIVEYVSHPVVHGFIQASVVTIILSQIDNWLGLKFIPRDILPQIRTIFEKLPESKIWDFALGAICMTCLFLMKKMKGVTCCKSSKEADSNFRKSVDYTIWLTSTSRNAIVVICAAGVSGAFAAYGIETPFTLTGTIPEGLPPFQFPAFTVSSGNETYHAADIFQLFVLSYVLGRPLNLSWWVFIDCLIHMDMTEADRWMNIGIGFLIVPLVGIIESIAIGKAFGRKNKYAVEPNQELLALGASNILGSFVSAYPVTASFSRSAVNAQSGVKTTAGGVYTGLLVILALCFLTPWFYYIPESALASIIIMAVIDMLDYTILIELWHIQKIDLIPWLITFVLGLILGVEYGLMLGVVASLCILLFPASRPRIKVHEITRDYIILNMDQGLRFPSAEYFKDHVRDNVAIIADGTTIPARYRSLIIDFKHVSAVDITTVQAFGEAVGDLSYVEAMLIICNVRPQVMKTLLKANIPNFRSTDTIEEAIELIMDEKKRVEVLCQMDYPFDDIVQEKNISFIETDAPSYSCDPDFTIL